MTRTHLHLFCTLLGLAATAQAAEPIWSGGITLASQKVERGLSESDGRPSLSADIEWSPRWGLFVGTAVATVDAEQFGGASLQWSPRLGWRGALGGTAQPLQLELAVTGHWFPGALGTAAAQLPPRLALRAGAQAQQTDFATAELGLVLAWRGLALRLDRALTDYYGIAAEERTSTGPLGERTTQPLASSAGSWHIGLQAQHMFAPQWSAWVGAGRQIVREFEELDYNDWRLGLAWQRQGLQLALELAGSDAAAGIWRVQRSDGSTRELSGRHAVLSLRWAFSR